jgi:glycosyltransferase involved in cell wall biosynthesis
LAPFVSFLCPTYNRYPRHGHLLEEAVESFRRQTYPAALRELVVLNDTPGQALTCQEENVLVVNLDRRFRTLGEKRNALVALSRGDVLLCQDDDDVSLPNRAEQAVRMLEGRCYWNPRHYWFAVGRGGEPARLEAPSSLGYAHNASAFTRQGFVDAGGYPFTSGDEDMHMDARLRKPQAGPPRVRDGLHGLAPEDWPYVYRWGVSPHHLSGRRDLQAHYDEIGERPVQGGSFEVVPRWRHDYQVLAQEAVARMKR